MPSLGLCVLLEIDCFISKAHKVRLIFHLISMSKTPCLNLISPIY